MTEQFFIDLLQKIYPCKQPFTLVLTHRRYKRLGMYNIKNRHIRIHDKDCTFLDCCYIAIHEYAHHLMYTEFDGLEYRPHWREFVFVYDVLVSIAIQHQLLPDNLANKVRYVTVCPADDVIIKMLKR